MRPASKESLGWRLLVWNVGFAAHQQNAEDVLKGPVSEGKRDRIDAKRIACHESRAQKSMVGSLTFDCGDYVRLPTHQQQVKKGIVARRLNLLLLFDSFGQF